MGSRTKWNWRITVSYFLLFSGAALLLSGIALFIAPSGRMARTTGWLFLGLDRDQWIAFHTVFGYASALFALAHIYLNRRCFVNYIKYGLRWLRLRPEFVLALVLALLLALAAIFDWPPVRILMDWGRYLSGR